MKLTIYVPDELAKHIKQHDDFNVSAVCQAALRQELKLQRRNEGEREAVAQLLADAMERIGGVVEDFWTKAHQLRGVTDEKEVKAA